MVDEVAMYPAVAILKWMHIDETEGQNCCGDRWIQLLLGAPVKSDHAVNKGRKIIGPGTDMNRNRCTCVPVVLTDEATLAAHAEPHESFVADDDPLQAQQFVNVERRLSRLPDCTSPALNAVLRWAFSLNDVTGPRILEQKKVCGPRKKVTWNRVDDC